VLSLYVDERHPLFTAVLPDSDGVLWARWRTEPTPSDHNWALLKTLYRGQICNGTVREIANSGALVDIGGFTAVINIPELSWRPVDHPVVGEMLRLAPSLLSLTATRDAGAGLLPAATAALPDDDSGLYTSRIVAATGHWQPRSGCGNKSRTPGCALPRQAHEHASTHCTRSGTRWTPLHAGPNICTPIE
jgi:hypothetical protein